MGYGQDFGRNIGVNLPKNISANHSISTTHTIRGSISGLSSVHQINGIPQKINAKGKIEVEVGLDRKTILFLIFLTIALLMLYTPVFAKYLFAAAIILAGLALCSCMHCIESTCARPSKQRDLGHLFAGFCWIIIVCWVFSSTNNYYIQVVDYKSELLPNVDFQKPPADFSNSTIFQLTIAELQQNIKKAQAIKKSMKAEMKRRKK